MLVYASIWVMSFIAPLIHASWNSKAWTKHRFIELLFLYQIVINVGVLGIFAFLGLTFLPEVAAAHLGWSTCHFEQELANVNLGFAIVAFLCIWNPGGFRTATALAASIWLFADGIDHFWNAVVHGNLSEGNTGLLFQTDIFIPIALWVLLTLRRLF